MQRFSEFRQIQRGHDSHDCPIHVGRSTLPGGDGWIVRQPDGRRRRCHGHTKRLEATRLEAPQASDRRTGGRAARGTAPKGEVILFDGSNLDAWQTPEGRPAGWKVANGEMEIVPGAGEIQTKGRFGDVQLHIEWAAPAPPAGKGQDRGNSGIFFMGLYELQILDSYRADTYTDGQTAAIYGQYPPLLNAARPPGQWQTYDVAFRRPRFESGGTLLEPAQPHRHSQRHSGSKQRRNPGRDSLAEMDPV